MRIDQILASDKLTDVERNFLHSILQDTWTVSQSHKVQEIGRNIRKREQLCKR